jgi:predicted O-methyltransferase YrrM
MKKMMIHEKLEEIEYPVENLALGDFDNIGEYTAKKSREQGSSLYNNVGCFFRPNYERGILIYSMIRRFKVKSYLEIGFGRGYSAMCAAKAMVDSGITDGHVYTVDPNIDENFLKQLGTVLPNEWFNKLEILRGTSDQAFEHLKKEERKFEFVYIDGDHRYDQVKKDWDNAKGMFTKYVLFDDYHSAGKEEKDIEVTKVVDDIEGMEKELIIMDRRIFLDDRGYSDEEIKYGQVLVKHPDLDTSEFLMDW